MNQEDAKALLTRVKNSLTITKVICTRSVKSSRGDVFVGMAAGWDSVEEDTENFDKLVESPSNKSQGQGMTMKEALLSACVLGMHVDIAAHEQAMAGGTLTVEIAEASIRNIKNNYSKLIAASLGIQGG